MLVLLKKVLLDNSNLFYGGSLKTNCSPVEDNNIDMQDTYKFPGGRDVKVVRKEDIINTIKTNIVDTEVALAIVRQCEVDAVNFMKKGRLTGIPFMGTIKVPDTLRMSQTKEQKDLIVAAMDNTTNEQFVMFRRNLAYDNKVKIKARKYYNYVLSLSVAKNRNQFKKMCKEKGEAYARLHFFLLYSVTSVNNEYIPVEDENGNY